MSQFLSSSLSKLLLPVLLPITVKFCGHEWDVNSGDRWAIGGGEVRKQRDCSGSSGALCGWGEMVATRAECMDGMISPINPLGLRLVAMDDMVVVVVGGGRWKKVP